LGRGNCRDGKPHQDGSRQYSPASETDTISGFSNKWSCTATIGNAPRSRRGFRRPKKPRLIVA
jgi:hypothetical protein